MAVETRRNLLSALQQLDNIRVICLFLGDRPGLGTKLAPDALAVLHEHLEVLGHVDCLGLVLYTRGGDTLVPLRLVNLFREYCNQLVIYVPFRAHSAGTMICLGADIVHMSVLGELSPIDPSVQSPLIPKIDGANIPIGIEDVISYLELAENRSGLTDQNVKAQVFLALAEKLGPIALGTINRTYLGIRALASELLETRKSKDDIKEHDKSKLIDYLTTKLYFHDRPICRAEARTIGMTFVAEPDPKRDRILMDLNRTYTADLMLPRPLDPSEYVQDAMATAEVEIPAAFIESEGMTHVFQYQGTIQKVQQPPPSVPPGVNIPNFAVNWKRSEWHRIGDP